MGKKAAVEKKPSTTLRRPRCDANGVVNTGASSVRCRRWRGRARQRFREAWRPVLCGGGQGVARCSDFDDSYGGGVVAGDWARVLHASLRVQCRADATTAPGRPGAS